uniref:DUF4806 domain-containing protein n=1 Tax=Anopheles epiroticus TaxID=199890 RepID=A0A182PWH2_9DIPT
INGKQINSAAKCSNLCRCRELALQNSKQIFTLCKLVITKCNANIDELQDLEESLTLALHSTQIKERLIKEIKASSAKQHMHEAVYLLFNRLFLTECCWSCRGGKIAFKNYTNILRLIKCVGGEGNTEAHV